MDLQGRFWVLTAAGLVLLATAFLAFKAYELDFMAFIVEHTLAEKLHPSVSRVEVRQRFQRCRERFESGQLTHRQYEVALLDAAAYIEKIQLLSQQDVDHIFQQFERKEP